MIEKLYQEGVISGWITDPFTRKTEPIIAESRTPNNYEIMHKINEIIDHINRLERVPTSNVQEVQVRHGRWEHDGYDFPHGNDWVHCSVCGKRGINVPADLTPFCPNCGAKMDLVGEEE